MSALAFAVVRFSEDETVSEVPTIWLENNNICWWPKTKNVTNLIIKQAVPDKQTWTQHEVVVESYCETLDKARKRADEENYTSSEERMGRGQRPKKVKVPYEPVEIRHGRRSEAQFQSSSDEENSEGDLPPTPPLTCLFDNPFSSLPTVTILDIPVLAEGNLHSSDEATGSFSNNMDNTLIADPQPDISTKFPALGLLNETCTEILEYVRSIDARLKTLEIGIGDADSNNHVLNIQKHLPFDSIEPLQLFDAQIDTDKDMQLAFLKFIKSIGGRDSRDNINRIFNNLFTNNLGTQCSWLGRRNNFNVSSLKMMKFVQEHLMLKFQDTTLSNIEKYSSEWLRLSKLRLTRSEMKKTTHKH